MIVSFFCVQVDKATGRFNGQFKTYAICGAIRRMVRAPVCSIVGVCTQNFTDVVLACLGGAEGLNPRCRGYVKRSV